MLRCLLAGRGVGLSRWVAYRASVMRPLAAVARPEVRCGGGWRCCDGQGGCCQQSRRELPRLAAHASLLSVEIDFIGGNLPKIRTSTSPTQYGSGVGVSVLLRQPQVLEGAGAVPVEDQSCHLAVTQMKH